MHTEPSHAPSLPGLQRARLEYLFDAMQRVSRAWPWMTDLEPCVLLLEPSVQWVLNCAEAPTLGFSRSTDSFRQHTIYERSGGTFTANGRELSTQEFLALTPATAYLDEPLARRTDLPSGHAWLVLGSLEALTKYHPAFANSGTEEWLSVAIHEFFHTQAMRLSVFAAELHAINTRATDPAPLAALYTHDAGYRALVEREYALLVSAAEEDARDRPEACAVLRAWLKLYEKRRAQLARREDGAEFVRNDALFTYVEGVARYVESTFLIEADQHPAHAIGGDARFFGFGRWSGRGYAAMPNRQLDPEYYYALGFHLAWLLDRIDSSWKQRVPAHPTQLVGVAHEINDQTCAVARNRR
jgi:hypothetical protein